MQLLRKHIILLTSLILLMSSCCVKKFVPENQHFLHKNKVVIKGDKVEFTKSDVSDYITQKPHKVRFPNKFSTWFYYKTEDLTDKGFWRWCNKAFGREPEYYDADAAYYSARQIEQYLDNRGYFNSKVTNKVKFRRYKAKATYTVYPSQPYRINKINYQIEDTTIARILRRLEERYPVKEHDIYNSYTMDEQRTLITDYLRNMGYYFFSRDYISYEVDSSFNNHTLDVTMRIANVKDAKNDTYHPHKQYYINKVSIFPNYTPMRAAFPPTDSTSITFNTGIRNGRNTLHFYYNERPIVKPYTFAQVISIFEGRPYRQRLVTLTYSSLSNLKLFTNASIEFDTVPSKDSLNLLNCNIMLRRSEINSVKLQAEGTNSGGDLGISGSATYTNKNIFHGAEVLTLSLKVGFEKQTIIDLGGLEAGGFFNTREIILNSSIFIPRFFSPIPLKTFAWDYQPRTTVSLGTSYQTRYAYSRVIAMGSYGYDWKTSRRLQYILTPVYLNYVKVNPIPEFQALLDQESNQRIKDQYTNHFIFGGRYSIIYSTQNVNRKQNYIYFRGNLESSGAFLSLFNKTKLISVSDNHHELFGIRYAQYLRGDVDFRQYYTPWNNVWFVFRQMIGLGVPYGNSYDMPFERSFYTGGSMGMRGWEYRQLGPGAYNPNNGGIANVERIGDIQLELNAELRFPLSSSLNGAVFVDVGNIWNYHANELLPNGEFHFNNFYKQLAMDAGIGFRYDLSMAIIRLDIAMPFRNPYPNEEGSHWKVKAKDLWDLNFNVNIGYPF